MFRFTKRRAAAAMLAASIVSGGLAIAASSASAHNIVTEGGVCTSQTSASFTFGATYMGDGDRTTTVTVAGVSGSTTVNTNGSFTVVVSGFAPQTGVVEATWTSTAVTPQGTPNIAVDFAPCTPQETEYGVTLELTLDCSGAYSAGSLVASPQGFRPDPLIVSLSGGVNKVINENDGSVALTANELSQLGSNPSGTFEFGAGGQSIPVMVTVHKPAEGDCTQPNPVFNPLVFCDSAGGTNDGDVTLTGTANGVPFTIEPGEMKFFAYDSEGNLNLVVNYGETVVYSHTLVMPEQCHVPEPKPAATYSGSVDCAGVASGSGMVDRDGLEGNLVVTVNGKPAVVNGNEFTFADAAQPLNVLVMIGETDVPVEGTLTGPAPGSCEPDTVIANSATITGPSCAAQTVTVTMKNQGNVAQDFVVTAGYAGRGGQEVVTVQPGKSEVRAIAISSPLIVQVTAPGMQMVSGEFAPATNCTPKPNPEPVPSTL